MSGSPASVLIAHQLRDPAELGAYATLADGLGFGTVWLTQSLVLEPRAAIAAAASRSRIAFGTAISIMQLEHPLKAAIEARSLSALTGGRFSLGLGVSEPAFVRDALGLPAPPAAPFAREYVSLVRDGVRTGRLDRTGRFFDVHVQLPPVAASPPPVLLAALQPRMARVAGETADGCLTWLAPPDYLRETLVPALAAGAAAAGRPRPRIVALVPVHPTLDRAEAVRAVERTIGHHLSRPHYRSMLRRAGLVRGEDGDVSCDRLLDSVVAWGDAARIRDRLGHYRRAGADEIAVAAYPGGRGAPRQLSRTWALAAEALGLDGAAAPSPANGRLSMTTPRELVETYVERVWNQGDLSFLDRCVRPGYVAHDEASGDTIRGAKGLKRHVAALRELLPDLHMTILDTLVDGDRVAWRWRMEGTHCGSGLGVAPSGRRIVTTGMAVYRIEGGDIVDRHGEADTLGLLRQLGVLRAQGDPRLAPA
jgi:alkanesulfonate monooxygenase SsuD/methylene tetrahydromethanopterin reductase-like flavin-dependent oxidoreductase (luciferase family)/predicted ester cyclase